MTFNPCLFRLNENNATRHQRRLKHAKADIPTFAVWCDERRVHLVVSNDSGLWTLTYNRWSGCWQPGLANFRYQASGEWHDLHIHDCCRLACVIKVLNLGRSFQEAALKSPKMIAKIKQKRAAKIAASREAAIDKLDAKANQAYDSK